MCVCCCEIRVCTSSKFVLFPQGCFDYSETLAFLCEFRISLSISVKSAIWDFDQIDSVNHHGECCLLNMKTFNPPTRGVFHLFRSLFMSLSIFFYSLQCIIFLFLLLNLLLSILFLFDAIVNEIVFFILLLGCSSLLYRHTWYFISVLHPAILMNSLYSSIIFSPKDSLYIWDHAIWKQR